MGKEKATPEYQNQQDSSKLSRLMVYNDDVNTFEHVIDTLIEVCEHNPEQAEQCTMIIHHKGKCIVKSGDKDTMNAMCEEIIDRNITAKVV